MKIWVGYEKEKKEKCQQLPLKRREIKILYNKTEKN